MGSIRRGIRRTTFGLCGVLAFTTAFLAGYTPRHNAARAADPGDDTVDDSITLPIDVKSRLAHAAPGSVNQDFRPAVTFWEVLGKVKSRYVDRITDQGRLTHGAVATMLRSLRDPYSRIVTPEELQLDQQQEEGHFNGVGAILGARLSGTQTPVDSGSATVPLGPPRREPDQPDRVWQLVVVDTVPGSPAARAGLQTGDVISKINGVRIDRPPLASKTIDDLNLLLNGPTVHTATVSVLRPSTNATLDLKMDGGAATTENVVEARMLPQPEQNEAYVRIRLFSPDAGKQFLDALQGLSPSHPTSLLLDLRDNPGGSLSSAEAVVGALAPHGPAGLLDAHGATEHLAAADEASTFTPEHLVVLVDSGTAQAAELVASALHERANAVLAGAPTFGNGLVQTVYPLNDGWYYSLTTGRLRGPNGTDFNQHGLAVQHVVPSSALQGDAAVNDAAAASASAAAASASNGHA